MKIHNIYLYQHDLLYLIHVISWNHQAYIDILCRLEKKEEEKYSNTVKLHTVCLRAFKRI